VISYVSRSWEEAAIMRNDGWHYVDTKSVLIYNKNSSFSRRKPYTVVILKKEFPAVENTSMREVA
jgi:hypothetical protein